MANSKLIAANNITLRQHYHLLQNLERLIVTVGWTLPARLAATAVFLVACGADFMVEEESLIRRRIINNKNNITFLEENFKDFRIFLMKVQLQRTFHPSRWFVTTRV